MTISDSKFDISINLETVVANADRVLSSAKLERDARATKRKKSFIDRLKRSGRPASIFSLQVVLKMSSASQFLIFRDVQYLVFQYVLKIP